MPEQADVVRRVFAWRAEGRSTSWIVRELNASGIPGPAGGVWHVSSLSGNRQRRNGILQNELYAGRIVFNRQRFVRDPVTRKRVSRANPTFEWKVQEVPELAIVDPATWAAVVALETAPETVAGVKRNYAKRLLSGLIRCGVCGGSFIVAGAERWGCGTAKSSGTCANNRTISTSKLEERVLGALRDRLLQPELVEAFIADYRATFEATRTASIATMMQLERSRAKVTGRIERLTDLLADGIGDAAENRKRITTALAERAEIEAKIKDADLVPALALHPNLAEAYRRNVIKLADALNASEMVAGEARQALRNLVQLITAEPRKEGRGVDLVVHGRLAQILQIANNRPDVGPDGCMFYVVAGTGFEPVTFRL